MIEFRCGDTNANLVLFEKKFPFVDGLCGQRRGDHNEHMIGSCDTFFHFIG